MANTKRRCRKCQQYRPLADLKIVGIQATCAGGCDHAPARVGQPVTERAPHARKRASGARSTGVAMDPVVRLQVLSRDQRCVLCGVTRDLVVHHITFRSHVGVDKGRDHPTNLVSLCQPVGGGCHLALAHGPDARSFQRMFRAYIWMLYVHHRQATVVELEMALEAVA